MVEKSRAKSSGKKKGTTKKKATSKKPVGSKAAKKAKVAAKPKPKAKPRAKAKKAAAPKKARVSIKDLLLKKFDADTKTPKSLYKPASVTAEIPDSPPFVTGQSAKETKRIRALLLKRFDLKAAPVAKVKKKAAGKPKAKAKPKAKTKKPAAPKKPKVSIKNLLLKKFDSNVVAAKSLYKPEATTTEIPDSPPFVMGLSAKETKRIKALLLKAFDLKAAPAKKKVAPGKRKATPAKKTAAKPKTKARKPAAPKKAKTSIKELLLKKFDTSTGGSLFKPEAVTSAIPDSPPFVTGYDAEDTKRIQALLLKAFDLKTEPAVEQAPEPVGKKMEGTPPPMPLPSVSGEGPGSVAKAMILGLCGLAVLVAFVISASFSNRDKFYLKEAHGAVQVWQGKFAPVGTELVMRLDGMNMPTPAQDVYSEQEAYQMVYNHFIGEADALLNEPGWPDFRKVNDYLRQAAAYAPTTESRMKVQARMNGLKFLVLLYKSDVALAKGTMADLEAAQEHLKKAAEYASIDYQRELIQRRRMAVERALAALATK